LAAFVGVAAMQPVEGVRAVLTPSVDYIVNWPVYVIELQGKLRGFYGLRSVEDELFLFDLWVAPEVIGQGLGRRLWRHLVKTARSKGDKYFLIESDPNAESFYLRMGARRVGAVEAPPFGRMLPLLRYDL
jgi:ribosomal protein S18 acetylase RimI-like enzyme